MSKKKKDWYLSNPHLWSDEKLGLEIYEKHILQGSNWLGWQPKQIAFLRDICDPSVKLLMAICNRGGAKTWLTSLGTCCLIDNLPKLRVSILSGSFDQASTCYNYLTDMILYSELNEKVKGDISMKRTNFTDGGTIRVLAASTKRTKAPRSDVLIVDESCEAKSEIIKTALPQTITATNTKIIFLTTPDDITHYTKQLWDDAEHLGIVRHHWTAYDCAWIPPENIKRFKLMYDDVDFRIMILAEWVARGGSVFRYSDIQRSLIDMLDLPSIEEMDFFFLGIDWGDAHDTVASVWGMRGDVNEGTDKWYLYAVKSWRRAELDSIIDGIYELCAIFNPIVLSEQSAISSFANRELRRKLSDLGIILRTDTFSGKKHRMVRNFNSRLEKGKTKIPRVFKKTIDQLVKYHYKVVNEEIKDEFTKKEDDFVDSTIWSHWGIHPSSSDIKTLGEYEF